MNRQLPKDKRLTDWKSDSTARLWTAPEHRKLSKPSISQRLGLFERIGSFGCVVRICRKKVLNGPTIPTIFRVVSDFPLGSEGGLMIRRIRRTLLGTFALGMTLGVSCEPTQGTQDSVSLPPVETVELPPTFESVGPESYVSKVKNLLTGLGPTDAELQAVRADEQALTGLIDEWMKTPQFQARMLRFFSNAFQQGQLNRASLIEMAPDAPISDRMLGNIQVQLPADGVAAGDGRRSAVHRGPDHRPVHDDGPAGDAAVRSWTTATPAIQNRGTDYITTTNPNFKFTLSNKSGPIPLEKTLDPLDPLFMNWYLPAAPSAGVYRPAGLHPAIRLGCISSCLVRSWPATGVCLQSFATPSQFADAEYDSWRMVTVRQPKPGEPATLFYDLRRCGPAASWCCGSRASASSPRRVLCQLGDQHQQPGARDHEPDADRGAGPQLR
jgi:hypothetical protein